MQTELANRFILICGCDLFSTTIRTKKRRELFFIQENMLIPAQVDGATETHHNGRQITNNTIDTER